MNSVRRSLGYSFAESYIVNALSIASIFVLSRLLTPVEIGVWAIAAVFAAIASTFRDFGVGEYLIQEAELSDRKLRAAFGVNIAFSWFTAVALFFASGWIAEFYREPGVASVMRVQAVSFLLIPFGAITFAYFRRNLDYRPFFWSSVGSSVTTFTVSIACALAGLGYMSFAWSSLAGVAVTVLVSFAFRPKALPRLPSLDGWREVVSLGKHVTGTYLVGQIGKSAPELIIGRVLGAAPVAFFSRANGPSELFNRMVLRAALPVCLPYFAREARGGQDVREGYLRTVSYITVIGWPFFVFLAAMAFPAIRILYGTQWIASVSLAQILCVAAAVEVTYFFAKELLIGRGDARHANLLQALSQAARVLGLVAVIPFDLAGACWGLLAAAIVGGVCAHRILAARIGLTLRHVIGACKASFFVTVISTAPSLAWAAFGPIGEDNFLQVMVVAGSVFGLMWIGALRCLRHPLWRELGNLRTRGTART